MKNLIFLLAILLLASSVEAQKSRSQTPTYKKFKVRAVHDGDTFYGKFVGDTTEYSIRPIGYDAYEIRSDRILASQPYGRIAGDTLRKLIKGKVILLDTTAIKGSKIDKYGRLLCEAYFPDSSSMAVFMVSSGLAWAVYVDNRRIPRMNTIIRNAHRKARSESIGAWAGYVDKKGKHHKPESPWRWRYWFGVN